MCAWLLTETLMVFPYYLTYFNQLAGGPSGGHRYVVDSNLDWGQDLKRLADWVDKNNIKKIGLVFSGWPARPSALETKPSGYRTGNNTAQKSFFAEILMVDTSLYQQ